MKRENIKKAKELMDLIKRLETDIRCLSLKNFFLQYDDGRDFEFNDELKNLCAEYLKERLEELYKELETL
jgi:hypothetical protein